MAATQIRWLEDEPLTEWDKWCAAIDRMTGGARGVHRAQEMGRQAVQRPEPGRQVTDRIQDIKDRLREVSESPAASSSEMAYFAEDIAYLLGEVERLRKDVADLQALLYEVGRNP